MATTLMVPLTPYPGRRPLLPYQPATDSLGDQCNPSYTLRTGTEKELPLLAGGLTRGWAVVVTDHQGPRDAYGAGRMAGRAVLDGVRATERLAGAATPVGLWGYSGGGLATGWASELQPSYAPEPDVRGVASGTPFAGLFLAAAIGVSREYPELLALLDDDGRRLVEDIGDMCVAEEALSYPFRQLNEFTTSTDPLSEPVARAVLGDNELGHAAPSAPVYVYHSIFDELIPFSSAQALRSSWCGRGRGWSSTRTWPASTTSSPSAGRPPPWRTSAPGSPACRRPATARSRRRRAPRAGHPTRSWPPTCGTGRDPRRGRRRALRRPRGRRPVELTGNATAAATGGPGAPST